LYKENLQPIWSRDCENISSFINGQADQHLHNFTRTYHMLHWSSPNFTSMYNCIQVWSIYRPLYACTL